MADYRTPGGYVEEGRGTGPADGRRAGSSDRGERAKVPLRVPPLTVSLAVFPVDGPTGESPSELPRVSLKGIDVAPKRKSDRYLLFLDVDLPEPPTSTVVSVYGGDQYRNVTHKVFVTNQEDMEVPPEVEVYPPSNPTITVRLFPDDATVLYGYVRDTDENRLVEAKLRVTDLDFDLAAETDANGRFVLYFEDAPADGGVEAELSHDELENPVSVALPVVAEEETVRTLVVDIDAETVTVHEGII